MAFRVRWARDEQVITEAERRLQQQQREFQELAAIASLRLEAGYLGGLARHEATTPSSQQGDRVSDS